MVEGWMVPDSGGEIGWLFLHVFSCDRDTNLYSLRRSFSQRRMAIDFRQEDTCRSPTGPWKE
jgi:hypothetical protein